MENPIQTLKWKTEKALLHNPYFYFYTKKMLQYMSFLLPHDRDYFALRHLALNDQTLFLDIGANDGISARSFRRLNTKFDIFSIEANPYHKASLDRLKRSDSKFQYQILGAGSELADLELFTPVYRSRIPLHSAASVDLAALKTNFEKVYSPRVVESTKFESSKIKVIPIDDLKLKPSIIKIDTEGFDYEVLKGLRQTISTYKPSIMVEAHEVTISKIIQILEEYGYVVCYYLQDQDQLVREAPKTVKNIFGIHKNYYDQKN